MSSTKMVFWGASEFAVPALELLVKNGFEIAAIVTAPDEPVGRRQILTPPSVKVAAQKLRLEIFQPKNLKAGGLELIENWKSSTSPAGGKIGNCDLGIVASYGKIIPGEIINSFPLGILNIHPSLLPKYRGPSPIQTQILNGETETGVTIMKIDDQVDHGPILVNQKSNIKDQKYGELLNELAELGAELLVKILPDYTAGKIKPVEQNHSQATFTKIIKKEDGRIDWSKSAKQIYNQFRAFHIWPGIWTVWSNKILKITDCMPAPNEYIENKNYGFVFEKDKKVLIKCGSDSLEILRLQLEGGREMNIRDFLPGHRDFLKTELE